MLFWKHEPTPPPPRALSPETAETMVEANAWESEREAQAAAEYRAYQRTRIERLALAAREEQLAHGKAELESDRQAFAILRGAWIGLLVVATLATCWFAIWVVGGGW